LPFGRCSTSCFCLSCLAERAAREGATLSCTESTSKPPFALRGLLALPSKLCRGELEPRAYRALPTGIDFTVAAYQLSSGNVVFDATSPVEDLEFDIHNFSLGYFSFGLGHRHGHRPPQERHSFADYSPATSGN
jgi:hypothetical protein